MTRLRTSPAAPANQPTTTHSAWVKTADAAKLIGLSPSCLKNYRLKKKLLIEGIHWVYTNSGRRTILYNVELLSDWVATVLILNSISELLKCIFLLNRANEQRSEGGRGNRINRDGQF